MKARIIPVAFFAITIMVICARPAFSQLTTALAQLNGVVRDEGGAEERLQSTPVSVRSQVSLLIQHTGKPQQAAGSGWSATSLTRFQ